MLGLRFCARASSSRGKRGPLPIAVRGPPTIAGLPPSRAPPRGAQAPDTQAQHLWLTGPATPRHAGSSQTRGGTRVPCISRQPLNHCATREAPGAFDVVRSVNMFWRTTPTIKMMLSFKRCFFNAFFNRGRWQNDKTQLNKSNFLMTKEYSLSTQFSEVHV